MQEDLPSRRGGRATTRRPSSSGDIAPVPNDEDLVLRAALGLPSSSRNPTASVAIMGTAGDDETHISAATSSLKNIGGPGLQDHPHRFKPATKRWSLGSRGRRRMNWGCLPSGKLPLQEPRRCLGLPPRFPNPTANVAMMGTADAD